MLWSQLLRNVFLRTGFSWVMKCQAAKNFTVVFFFDFFRACWHWMTIYSEHQEITSLSFDSLDNSYKPFKFSKKQLSVFQGGRSTLAECRFLEHSISQHPDNSKNQQSFPLELFRCIFIPFIWNCRFLRTIFVSLGGSRNQDNSTVHWWFEGNTSTKCEERVKSCKRWVKTWNYHRIGFRILGQNNRNKSGKLNYGMRGGTWQGCR